VEWGKAPWTLKAYVVITLAGAVFLAITTPGPVGPRLFIVPVEAVICFFLLQRVHWLWVLMIAFIPLGFALGVIEANLTWHGTVIGVVDLVLLLHPATRRFFRRAKISTAV
jgi:hypothetical protein